MLEATVDARKVRARCDELGLNVRELLPRVTLHRGKKTHLSTLEHIMANRRQPSAPFYKALCAALECEFNDLLVDAPEALAEPQQVSA